MVGKNNQFIWWWIISFKESLCTDAEGRGLMMACNGCGKKELRTAAASGC